MDGPTQSDERKKSPAVTDRDFAVEITESAAQEAYVRGDAELFGRWYEQEQNDAELDPTGARGILLDIKLARLKHGAGDHADAAGVLEGAILRAQHNIRALESATVTDESAERGRLSQLESLQELESQMWTFMDEIKG